MPWHHSACICVFAQHGHVPLPAFGCLKRSLRACTSQSGVVRRRSRLMRPCAGTTTAAADCTHSPQVAEQHLGMAALLVQLVQHLFANTVWLLDLYWPHLVFGRQAIHRGQAKDANLQDRWWHVATRSSLTQSLLEACLHSKLRTLMHSCASGAAQRTAEHQADWQCVHCQGLKQEWQTVHLPAAQ